MLIMLYQPSTPAASGDSSTAYAERCGSLRLSAGEVRPVNSKLALFRAATYYEENYT